MPNKLPVGGWNYLRRTIEEYIIRPASSVGLNDATRVGLSPQFGTMIRGTSRGFDKPQFIESLLYLLKARMAERGAA